MSSDDEKGRENWHRITLRLPPELHQRIVESAGKLSVNAAIVQRLEQSFEDNTAKLKSYDEMRAAIMAEVEQRMEQRFEEWLEQIKDDELGQSQRDSMEDQ